MNTQIASLHRIAGQESRRIIGLMSGTSLDGLDIALCRIWGSGKQTSLIVEHFETIPYGDEFRDAIRQVFSKKTIDHQRLCQLNAIIGTTHGMFVRKALEKWGVQPAEVDLVASHGQTVYHAPQSLTGDSSKPNSTLQIGDGDHVAWHSGIITVSDFRQKHVAAGGEGAPLAAYGDYLLFGGEGEDRVLLNIGGISNFTYLPATGREAFATDIGPGNTLMNQVMFQRYGKEMDEGGQLAQDGRVNDILLETLLEHPFFEVPFPKTTGPELFNLAFLEEAQRRSLTQELVGPDLIATLTAFTAEGIVRAVRSLGVGAPRVYISGGGVHNPVLMREIVTRCKGVEVLDFKSLGMEPDAKEAVLFAVLANETVAGDAENTQGLLHSPPVCMGKVSLPK